MGDDGSDPRRIPSAKDVNLLEALEHPFLHKEALSMLRISSRPTGHPPAELDFTIEPHQQTPIVS